VTDQEGPELYTVGAKSLDIEAVIKVVLLDRCVTVDALGYAGLGSSVAVNKHLCRHCVRVQVRLPLHHALVATQHVGASRQRVTRPPL